MLAAAGAGVGVGHEMTLSTLFEGQQRDTMFNNSMMINSFGSFMINSSPSVLPQGSMGSFNPLASTINPIALKQLAMAMNKGKPMASL